MWPWGGLLLRRRVHRNDVQQLSTKQVRVEVSSGRGRGGYSHFSYGETHLRLGASGRPYSPGRTSNRKPLILCACVCVLAIFEHFEFVDLEEDGAAAARPFSGRSTVVCAKIDLGPHALQTLWPSLRMYVRIENNFVHVVPLPHPALPYAVRLPTWASLADKTRPPVAWSILLPTVNHLISGFI